MRKGERLPFSKEADFKLLESKQEEPELRQPNVEIRDYALFTAMKIAKLGYYGGNPEAVMNAPADIVVSILNYESFDIDVQGYYTEERRKRDAQK